MSWENRIVGHGEEPLDQIMLNPWNWKIHPKAQMEGLLGAITELGFLRSVTVNRTTGNLVDGHARVLLADREGQSTIPVEYVELSEEEERKALLSIDPLGALATAQEERLQGLLLTAQPQQEGVEALLADVWERHIGGKAMAPQASDASYRENPYEGMLEQRTTPPTPPGRTEVDLEESGAVRVITVYCNQAEYDRTMAKIDRLREAWAIETTTELVLEVIKRAGATPAQSH